MTADYYRDANHRIDYVLDQNHVERKVVAGDKTVESKHNVQMGAAEVWPLEISIQRDTITITSGGKLIDEFQRPDPSAAIGRFGIKGDVELKDLGSR